MGRITISSSLKNRELIRTAIADFKKIGIDAIFPNLDATVTQEPNLEMMKMIEGEHFNAINESEAVYVICPAGRVGTLVSVEIGYAKAQNKPVYFSENPVDLGLQALVAGIISLARIAEGNFLS